MFVFTALEWTGNIAFDLFFNIALFFGVSGFIIRTIINFIQGRRW